jgi:hypothetical protein
MTMLVRKFPSSELCYPQMLPNIFHHFLENFDLSVALWMCWRGFGVYATFNNSIISAACLLMNSFPPSVCIWAGIPNLQNHSLKMASATVSAFLFWIAKTTAYLVNAPVMPRTNFLLLPAVNIGPNKSAWILQLGQYGIGREDKAVGLAGVCFLC